VRTQLINNKCVARKGPLNVLIPILVGEDLRHPANAPANIFGVCDDYPSRGEWIWTYVHPVLPTYRT
jgi:hypothetical protein